MTAVIPWVGADGEPEEPSKARAFLERQTLPTPGGIARSAHWWATEGSKGAGALVLKAPYLALLELRPIFRGLGRILGGWSRWCAAADLAGRLTEAESKSEKAALSLESAKSGRRKMSLALFLLLTGGGTWAYFAYPLYLALAGIVLVLVCDAVGRMGTEKVTALPPPMRTVLKEGVPLSQVTAAIVDTMLREGLEVGISRELRYDASRHEYRMQISCLDELKPEHLRAIERGIGADDHTIRNLATGTATVRELVIRDGDPLAVVPQPEWIDDATIAQPLEVGVSVTEQPFAMTFAGVHTAIIGRTGSGKTKGMLWAIIDRLVACRDVVLYGVDLAGGPALPMWRGCIQRSAYNPEDAQVLLDAVCAEIDRRMDILRELAENDIAEDDQDEWASNLGPALVVVIDEFALVAEQNGEKGKADLMVRVEKVLRLGRKCWVTLCLATQKAGNSDLGSTVAAAQIGLKILMSCTERDTTLMLGTEMRDAGWAPHMLQPATEGSLRDAGKAYVYGPAHHTPDVYRSFAPMTPGEVKRRARQRIEDGLPSLHGRRGELEVIEACELPTILADVEKAFAEAGNPDKLATAELLGWLDDNGYELDAKKLADQLRPLGLRPNARWRPAPGVDSIRGYLLSDLHDALEKFDG